MNATKFAAALIAVSLECAAISAKSAELNHIGPDHVHDAMRGALNDNLQNVWAAGGKPHAVEVILAEAGASEGTVIERTLGDGPAETIEVTHGSAVRLVLHAPEGTEFHLHGYDLTGTAGPDGPVIITFLANHVGRFPIEAHGIEDGLSRAEKILAYIEVRPK